MTGPVSLLANFRDGGLAVTDLDDPASTRDYDDVTPGSDRIRAVMALYLAGTGEPGRETRTVVVGWNGADLDAVHGEIRAATWPRVHRGARVAALGARVLAARGQLYGLGGERLDLASGVIVVTDSEAGGVEMAKGLRGAYSIKKTAGLQAGLVVVSHHDYRTAHALHESGLGLEFADVFTARGRQAVMDFLHRSKAAVSSGPICSAPYRSYCDTVDCDDAQVMLAAALVHTAVNAAMLLGISTVVFCTSDAPQPIMVKHDALIQPPVLGSGRTPALARVDTHSLLVAGAKQILDPDLNLTD
jgi:hypothetical protein